MFMIVYSGIISLASESVPNSYSLHTIDNAWDQNWIAEGWIKIEPKGINISTSRYRPPRWGWCLQSDGVKYKGRDPGWPVSVVPCPAMPPCLLLAALLLVSSPAHCSVIHIQDRATGVRCSLDPWSCEQWCQLFFRKELGTNDPSVFTRGAFDNCVGVPISRLLTVF